MKLTVGQAAPDFSLPDQDNNIHSLHDYTGKWIVLYFYPKDDTPGCTKEACSFRDISTVFSGKNITVLGVSKDNPKSHKKFAEKFNLNFSLLSDVTKEMIQSYDSLGEKKFMGKTYMGIFRNTFLIDPQGNIAKIYEKVDPVIHADEILKDIEQLQ